MISCLEIFKKCIWYGMFLALLSIAVSQLKDLYVGWEDRPFDTVVENVPKQDIPYPSVTICPSGKHCPCIGHIFQKGGN